MLKVCLWQGLRWLLKLLYRVEVSGLQEFYKAGERVLIIANHSSFLDAVLLAVFLPGNVSYVIHRNYYDKWWVKIVRPWVQLFSVDHQDPMSIKSLIKLVKSGQKVVIFPEGRITLTGSLMKVYAGPGMVADKAGASILPIRIDGAQYTPFSRMHDRLRWRFFPKIKLTVLAAKHLTFQSDMSARERRHQAGKVLADVMCEMMFETTMYRQRLWDSLLEAAATHGYKHQILEDVKRNPMSYKQLVMRSFLLGDYFYKQSSRAEHVGVLLPNTAANILTVMALQSRAMVPVMLNYSLGVQACLDCVLMTNMRLLITSRDFIDQAGLQALDEKLNKHVKVIYLEDIKQELTLLNKLHAYLSVLRPKAALNKRLSGVKSDDAAVLLFTSGSEGSPKAVALSHQNLLANVAQVSANFDFSRRDICLNVLPNFHSFGLTVGTFLPILSGMKVFLYPSPLHYRVVPEIAYDINATIFLGTNVFLSAYAKYAHPYDFYALRYVIAGAEKLQVETKQLWMDKFGLRIFEGYGATETSPVISVNTPMNFRAGSVGRLLPGLSYKIEPVQGISDGGRLWVKGPNVMKGYLLADGQLQALPGGWYDTGDVVRIDEGGFVYILGRLKRFAKVAGEMVSLTAVQEMAEHCWPDAMHVALIMHDVSKGEQVILLTTQHDADRKQLKAYAKTQQLNELQVPKQYVVVADIPVTGIGKIDYPAAEALLLNVMVTSHES
ncbi:MAG: AMP-binding protein [Mariprofundaceae bacterium]